MAHSKKGISIYTTVIHEIRLEKGLSCLEYCFVDTIDKLSNNHEYPWCVTSKPALSEFLGITKMGLYNILNRMIEMGYIEKNKKGHLRTTELWKAQFIEKEEDSSDNSDDSKKETVNKVYPRSKQSTPPSKQSLPLDKANASQDGKKSTSPYITNINKDINNIGYAQKNKISGNVENSVEKSNNSAPRKMSDLLQGKLHQLSMKVDETDKPSPIKTAHQAYGLEAWQKLKLSAGFKGRVFATCKGQTLYKIQTATDAALKFRPRAKDEEAIARYFFKCLS